MKQKDVKVGEIYLTKVGGELRRVQVEREVERVNVFSGRAETRFEVRELRSKKLLPKSRTAAALREIPVQKPDALYCKWCRQAFELPAPTLPRTLENRQRERDEHEARCPKNPERVDVIVENHGTLYTFVLVSEDALSWVHENVQQESHNWLGNRALAVEHRYAGLLADGLREAGFKVR